MKNRPDYYQILHVQPDAPKEIIRSSYRTLMQRMRMHPDLGGDGAAAAMLNEAYATLTDPADRSAYDKSRQPPERFDAPGAAAAGRQSIPLQRCAFCAATSEDSRQDASCGSCDSPLFLAEQAHIQESDRRASSRVVNDHAMIFCTHWPQSDPHSSRAVDVSLNGMKFSSNTSLGLGQVIKIDSQILSAVARVVRSQQQHGGWEIGVHFITLCFVQSRGSFIEHHA
jgi:curved DNA-binding protein CbpA